MAQPARKEASLRVVESDADVVDLAAYREAKHPTGNPLLAYFDVNNVTKRELRIRLEALMGRSVSASWVNRQMLDPVRPLPHIKQGPHRQSPVLFPWPEVIKWVRARQRIVR